MHPTYPESLCPEYLWGQVAVGLAAAYLDARHSCFLHQECDKDESAQALSPRQ